MKNFAPLAIDQPVIGFPARIGTITRLDGTVIRFAESDVPLVVDGDTYPVVPGLSVSAVKHTYNGETPSCQIVAVQNVGSTFDSNEIDVGLFDGATVQIYIVDRKDLSRKGLLFTGAISDIGADPVAHQASFNVKGATASAKVLLIQKRAPMCRTDLFSVLCGVNKTGYAVTSTVASIVDDYNFTVTGSLAQSDGYFNLGVVITATGVGFQVANWSQADQKISTFLGQSRILTVGMGLTLYPGCDKTLGFNGCGKFNNQINFQGEPHFLGVAAASQQV